MNARTALVAAQLLAATPAAAEPAAPPTPCKPQGNTMTALVDAARCLIVDAPAPSPPPASAQPAEQPSDAAQKPSLRDRVQHGLAVAREKAKEKMGSLLR